RPGLHRGQQAGQQRVIRHGSRLVRGARDAPLLAGPLLLVGLGRRLAGDDQGNGDGGQPLAATGQPEPVGGGGGHRHPGPHPPRGPPPPAPPGRWPFRGGYPMIAPETWATAGPAAASRRTASASNSTPGAPAQRGSAVPNWVPRSPSPPADSSAST